MTTSARVIANAFIEQAKAVGKEVTPLQLMKLVYIAHGWMLGLYGRPLVTDSIEAWKYGPVIEDLYHEMKKYGGGSVLQELPIGSDVPVLDFQEADLVRQVYGLYNQYSGIALSARTHQDGTPWSLTYSKQQNNKISNDLITDHYQRILSERRAAG